jgi:transposase-like protein
MHESIPQGALDLPLEQEESLIECLKGAVLARMSSVREGEPDECPRCHHDHVVREGRAKDGSQRWLCRGCGWTC